MEITWLNAFPFIQGNWKIILCLAACRLIYGLAKNPQKYFSKIPTRIRLNKPWFRALLNTKSSVDDGKILDSETDSSNIMGNDEKDEANEEFPFYTPYNDASIKHIPYVTHDKKVMGETFLPEAWYGQSPVKRARDFYTFMNLRRSIRFFDPTKIPPLSVMEDIIKTAGTGPSGAHSQPWTFVLVSDPVIKNSLRSIVEAEEEINYAKRMGARWLSDIAFTRTNHVKAYLTQAPYIIVVMKQVYGLEPSSQDSMGKKTHYYQELSVGIACGILVTAIHYAGLVTLTSTPLNAGNKLRILLGRPNNEKVVLLLPVGYPCPKATVPQLNRKTIDEIMVHPNTPFA